MMKSLCHYTAILAMALTFLAPTAVYADGAAAPSMLDVTPKPDVKAFYDAHLAVIVDGLTKISIPCPE